MSIRSWRVVLVLSLALACRAAPARGESIPQTTLRFEVTVAPGLLSQPTDGRLLVVLGRDSRPEPRRTIGRTGLTTPPVLGRDVMALAPGVTGALDQACAIFPLDSLARLPAGEYHVQAVFDHNSDLKLPGAPGNLYSKPQPVRLDPARGGTVKIELTQQVPADEPPADTDYVKYLKVRSELLSKFHGRPIYLRAAVILPRDYDREKERCYPLRVHVGGYGTRYLAAGTMMAPRSRFRDVWLADDTPRFLLLHLDGAGPLGDPYQVNSANHGPFGDAITQELIPHVERRFRAVGTPEARVVDGASTGGWVSLALQVFYPDFFNGAWSQCPDPVDFRAYELINIYEHDNAYVNPFGFERPAKRQPNGETAYTVRHECQVETVLGRGDRWTLSGRDWCAWNATFGPRGADGLPRPLWDGKTGVIDRDVVAHWKQYDLRLYLEKNWATLGPKLRGKIHVWVGDADDYFLNNAVHLLDASLRKARPPFEGKIVFGAGQGHTTGWGEKQLLQEMGEATMKTRP